MESTIRRRYFFSTRRREDKLLVALSAQKQGRTTTTVQLSSELERSFTVQQDVQHRWLTDSTMLEYSEKKNCCEGSD